MNYALAEYAGFWRRFAALVVDGFIIFVISLLFKIFALDSLGLNILLGLLYTPFFESSELQATPGKAILDMKVVDMNGQRVSFKKALIRYLVRIVSGMLLCAGFLLMLFTQKKQCLHDLAAETLVVRGEIQNLNHFQSWYQQVLQVLGMVDKVPTAGSTATAASPADLANLYELYQKGLLSEAEYNLKREELLKKL